MIRIKRQLIGFTVQSAFECREELEHPQATNYLDKSIKSI
jgi:hypothetical protein